MSKSFSGDRCVPWLYSQAGVRVEGEPKPVAPAVDEVRGRVPRRAALGLKFGGMAGLFAAAMALMAGARPAKAEGPVSQAASVRAIAGYTLGGLSIASFAIGRRLDRTAPALAILCAARGAELTDHQLAALAGDARKRLTDASFPDGQVWLISEAPLADGQKAEADALKVRCFAPVQGRIVEV
ncbi:hypothetical protein [Nannocystis bainbridge]|uniref:Uncharacterized protein n=1 Tax=Nannocystis bainbridge TaxID=2995303 RepID=A0ABT5E204_9BACT|nr:hypothetical protein [Nannocystis bainbridge]MDC0718772.1 hypothetical protein [Nannocystis bainbridge]